MVTSFERKVRIREIQDTLRKFKHSDKLLDQKEFVLLICSRYFISQRVATEYIEIAKKGVKW